MKLISIQQAISQVGQWVNLPDSHELKRSGIYRNPEYNQQPFYKIELEWNKRGEADLDKDGLVNRLTIRAELDAQTGRLLAFYRHDHRPEHIRVENEMEESSYEVLYPRVLDWIGRLELGIKPQELKLVRKTVIGGALFRMSFQRQYQGISIRDYQALEIKLNTNYELIHLNCTWDECAFEERTGLIPESELRQSFGNEQLSLAYISYLASAHPFYMYREETYNAHTGQLVYSDQPELLEIIDLSTTMPQRNEQISVLHQPIFDADYDSLKLENGVSEADPYAPHPFFTTVTEEDILKSKDIAVSYLKTHHNTEPCQFAFIRRPGHDVVKSMQGNQIVVEIHRVVNDISVIGAGIRLVIDHNTWKVKNVVDALEFTMAVNELELDELQKSLISSSTAWEHMKEKINLKLQYLFERDVTETAGRKAILTYVLESKWICDACTGEIQLTD